MYLHYFSVAKLKTDKDTWVWLSVLQAPSSHGSIWWWVEVRRETPPQGWTRSIGQRGVGVKHMSPGRPPCSAFAATVTHSCSEEGSHRTTMQRRWRSWSLMWPGPGSVNQWLHLIIKTVRWMYISPLYSVAWCFQESDEWLSKSVGWENMNYDPKCSWNVHTFEETFFYTSASETAQLCFRIVHQSIPFLWAQYCNNALRDFPQIWHEQSLGLNHELLRFCRSKLTVTSQNKFLVITL